MGGREVGSEGIVVGAGRARGGRPLLVSWRRGPFVVVVRVSFIN